MKKIPHKLKCPDCGNDFVLFLEKSELDECKTKYHKKFWLFGRINKITGAEFICSRCSR